MWCNKEQSANNIEMSATLHTCVSLKRTHLDDQASPLLLNEMPQRGFQKKKCDTKTSSTQP